MIVDIRKFSLDSWINELVSASKIKKTWYGKTTDNYWAYLDNSTTRLEIDLNAHLFSDLLTFLLDELNIKEGLQEYSNKLSTNRKSAVFVFALTDRDNLSIQLNKESFINDFEIFCRKLNGSYYDYSLTHLSETVANFKKALAEMNDDFGLIVNIG